MPRAGIERHLGGLGTRSAGLPPRWTPRDLRWSSGSGRAWKCSTCRNRARYPSAKPFRPTAFYGLPRMNNHVPASSAQRMLWLFEQAERDKPAYNLPRALLIKGKLDIDALRDSFRTLVRRHDALRMRFVEQDGEILQAADENLTIDLPVRDLTHLPRDERMTEALRQVAAEGRVAFDLSRAPLLRIVLLRIDDDAQVLCLVVHHIVTDGWSMSIVFDEIAEIY